MTDKHLCKLWSKAVRAQKGEQCYNSACDKPAHSVHHVIKRRHMMLKYDVTNGIPLCADCHNIADHDQAFAFGMLSEEDREYLVEVSTRDFKDWLVSHAMSSDEFMADEAEVLNMLIRRSG